MADGAAAAAVARKSALIVSDQKHQNASSGLGRATVTPRL
jgi:hypothetical protein|tara:strand:+ start:313 stop:432 length:120 start_codon:yes stop_codon:yes gene_type:complete